MDKNRVKVEYIKQRGRAWNEAADAIAYIFKTSGRIAGESYAGVSPIRLAELPMVASDLVEQIAASHNIWSSNPSDKDMITEKDVPQLVSTAITRTVRGAAEPLMVLTPLLSNLPIGNDESFSEEYLSSIMDVVDWVSSNGELPSAGVIGSAMGAGFSLRKFGGIIEFSEDVIRRSKWGVVQFYINELAKDMARFKERQAARVIFTSGTFRIQGKSTGSPDSTISRYGYTVSAHANAAITSGRSIADLTLNATLSLNDLLDMTIEEMNQGAHPDTLITHPYGWKTFALNGELKEFAKINGLPPYYRLPDGSGIDEPFEGGLAAPTAPSRVPNGVSYSVEVPDLYPKPFNLVISPFAPVDVANNTCDIAMCVSGQIGLQLTGEGVETDKWTDIIHGISTFRLQEYWNVLPLNGGKYTLYAADISLARSADWSTIVSYTELP